MRCVALAILLLGGGALAHAADDALVGAAAVLAKQAPACPPGGCKNDDVFDTASARAGLPPALRARIDALAAEVAAYHGKPIGGADAAARWTALLERWIALARETRERGPHTLTTTGDDLFRVLPAPSTWRGIAAALRKAHPAGGAEHDGERLAVLALAAKLAADDAALRALAPKLSAGPSSAKDASRGDEGEQALWRLGRVIDEQTEADPVERFVRRMSSNDCEGQCVPDLVTLAGEKRATVLLTQALTENKSDLDIPVGEATRALAARLALQNVDKLRAPQWRLIRGLDCIPLYEAMEKRFGTGDGNAGVGALMMALVFGATGPADDSPARHHARLFYLAALIAKGRTADAERVAGALGGSYAKYAMRDVLDALDRSGQTEAVYAFLDAFVAHHPAADLWSTYLDVAARLHKQDDVLVRLRASMALPDAARNLPALRERLIDALLAADKIDEAVAEIDKLLADTSTPGDSRTRYALKLAEVGRLLDKPAWVDRGLAVDAEVRSKGMPSFSMYDPNQVSRRRLLRQLHRYAAAEALAAASVGTDHAQEALVELAGIYHDANRPADVLYLLDHAHGWRVNDLGALGDEGDSAGNPLAFLAAQALHETHRDAEAIRVLESVLDVHGGFDPAYALYASIKGPAAIADFDRLYKVDQFEERPLIWKATLLLHEKRDAEAEAVARDAVAIDPSDGEEPAGDRLRAYTVLADALEARKSPGDEAATYRNAVAAIRESEHADQFRLAGLHARAVAMYAHALEAFSGAYCIQSRLAVELNERGDSLLAAEHYRRAYELMPSSFGRMESHCLGCENVFGGTTAQGIAQQVFTNLIAKMPANPRVRYLMGYLRETEGQYAQAYAEYSIATTLDADYINAWKHMFELSGKIDLGAAANDRAALRMLALDPRERHVHVSWLHVADWTSLYAVAEKTARSLPPAQPAIYALGGSKRGAPSMMAWMDAWRRSSAMDADTTGGSAVAGTSLARAILDVFNRDELSDIID